MTSLLKLPPLKIAALYLAVLAILGVGIKLDLEYTLMRVLGFAALAIGFYLIPVLKHKAGALKHPFITNNLISVLIMFLVLDEFSPLWLLLILGLVASAIKHFVRLNRQPVFNPAAAGILVAALLGGLETWWGASFSPRFTDFDISIAAFLTVPAGIYLAYKYKNWGAALGFLSVYCLLMTFWLKTLPILILLEGTILFFALIMVSEPKTSPNNLRHQLIFGTFVGAISMVAIASELPSPYAIALLLANVGFRLFMVWQQKQHAQIIANRAPAPVLPPPQT